MGASIVSDKVAKVINGSDEFAHGYTYSAHPLACMSLWQSASTC